MRYVKKNVVVIAVILACLGCRAQQLARDQNHIREAVMDLHTNQIMDNLIRARHGLPILQLDYIHMTGTVTDTGSASTGNIYTDARTAAVRTLTDAFNINASGSKVNQLTITAEPVTTAPEVYNAYLEFLKEPGHLVESPCPPPPNCALIVRCCAADSCSVCPPKWHQPRVYYSVPLMYKDDFFKLSMYTVSLRGQPAAVSPEFEATILGFNPDDMRCDRANKACTYYVRFSIDKDIPNDDGYLIATIDGKRFENAQGLRFWHNKESDRAVAGQRVTSDKKSSSFVLEFNAKQMHVPELTIDDVAKALTGQKAKIHLDNFVPSGSPTDRLLEDVRSQVELNRLDQFQLIPTGIR
jgi:hypothetical protein